MQTVFVGSCVAIVTPFKNSKIDYDKLKELIDWHIDKGTDAILIAGTTGETSTLSDEEHMKLLKVGGQYIAGRVPYLAGTGSNDTAYSIMLSKYAEEECGADAVLVINPYYNKSTQRGIYAHIKAIADAISLPIVIYNVPSRTGMNISVDTLKKLSAIDNIQAVKEASADICQITEIARVCGDDLDIYSGNDDHVLPVLSIGGKGVISVSANIIPTEMHNLVQSFMDGDINRARDIQLNSNIINRAVFYETNPIPVKTAMELMGLLDNSDMRLPLVPMEDGNLAKLTADLREFGLIN